MTLVVRGWRQGCSALSNGCVLLLLLNGACSGERPTFDKLDAAASDPNGTSNVEESNNSDAGTNTSSSNEFTISDGENSTSSGGNGETDTTTGDCSTGCRIGGTCYLPGAVNPENPCVACVPGDSRTEWTNDDEATCNDDKFCTVDDHCSGGICVGEVRPCDDDVACNGEATCNESEDACEDAESICENGETCDVENDMCGSTCGGCAIDGNCYDDEFVSPNNPCMVCNVSASADEWSVAEGETCDDDDLCTEQDQCNAEGQCVGEAVTCQDDGGDCGATRACNPDNGQCATTFPGDDVTCDDDNACTEDDRCDGSGACLGAPAVGDECACLQNSDCNDNVACTTDTCDDGVCSNVLQAGSCRINGTCFADDAPDPANACRYCDASANQTGWTNFGSTTTCDDGLWCNGTDTCNAGTCTHSFPNNNRCATATGECETTQCVEGKNNCFQPPDTKKCDTERVSACVDVDDGCGGSVLTWDVDYYCSGSNSDCSNAKEVSLEDEADEVECTGATVCDESSFSCEEAIQCDSNVYCSGDLCWTRTDSSSSYNQDNAKLHCLNDLPGEWRLPTRDDFEAITDLGDCSGGPCPIGQGPGLSDCYWPVEMGVCAERYWTADAAFAWAVVEAVMSMDIPSNTRVVRCVTEAP